MRRVQNLRKTWYPQKSAGKNRRKHKKLGKRVIARADFLRILD